SAMAAHCEKKPLSSVIALGEVAAVADTGAPMASSVPVTLSVVETIFCGWASSTSSPASCTMVRGQPSCAPAGDHAARDRAAAANAADAKALIERVIVVLQRIFFSRALGGRGGVATIL